MNKARCIDCGFEADVNYFNLTQMDEDDPNPVIECPECLGVAELIDEE